MREKEGGGLKGEIRVKGGRGKRKGKERRIEEGVRMKGNKERR